MIMRQLTLSLVATCALSASAAQPIDSLNSKLYRLFTPVTFYHQVASNQLSLNAPQSSAEEESVDDALLAVYLNRPDLVETTESELEQLGSLRNDIDEPITQQVELARETANHLFDEPDSVPSEVMVTKPKFWTKKGDGFLQFLQNYISGNWYKGGESNYALMGNLTLEANYDNKSKWKWDNKLEAKLGFQTSRSDSLHKFKSNEDLLRLTSKVGLEATKKWYYTLQAMAWTQFARGFKSNDPKTYSDFMSPFNLNIGLGMDYKIESKDKKLTGSVNIAPIAVNYLYVDRSWFTEDKWFPSRHGVKDDKHSLVDFGSQVTANVEWKMSETVKWESLTRLYIPEHGSCLSLSE